MSRRLAPALLVAFFGLQAAPAAALLWPSEVSRIERDLTGTDVEQRRRAAARIVELGPGVAARVLDRALDDPDVEVRLSAASAARALGLTSFGERVMVWLTDPDARLRLEAIELTLGAPAERVVAPLTRALADVEPGVRAAAANALGRSGAADAVPGLLGRLDDSALEVKTSVIRALSRLGDARAVVPLISKIEDPRAEVRRAVARALGELGDRRAESALVLSLRDNDESVRVAALGALAELSDPAATPSVAALLASDASLAARRAAIQALSSIGGADAIAALVRRLGASDEDREAIVTALGRMGPSAAPALTQCLSSEAEPARIDGCARAVARAAGSAAGPSISEAVRRGRVGAVAALEAMAEAAPREALWFVLDKLGHEDPTVRKAALAAAERLLDPEQPDGRAVEPLERAFEAARGRRPEQVLLLRLLGQTGSPRAVKVLGPIADRADDLELRVTALAALGSISAEPARPVLLRALSDREASVRLTAALSLRKSSSGSAGELLDRLERAESQDRPALALALAGAFGAKPGREVLARLVSAMERGRDGERDALIEAAAQAPVAELRPALERLSTRADADDRRKVAEVSALDREATARLSRLAADKDAGVRASAFWSLGAVGGRAELPLLERGFGDRDPGAAANAVAAYARIGLRERIDAAPVLCRTIAARRAAVRENALSGLRLVGSRCAGAPERKLFSDDPSPLVRRAAAELVRDVTPAPEDRRALRRCAVEEPDGAVALACSAAPTRVKSGHARSLVFVVPVGEAAPTPRAPFALMRPDGLTRHGTADRRGAVYELELPEGELELGVPAPFGD